MNSDAEDRDSDVEQDEDDVEEETEPVVSSADYAEEGSNAADVEDHSLAAATPGPCESSNPSSAPGVAAAKE